MSGPDLTVRRDSDAWGATIDNDRVRFGTPGWTPRRHRPVSEWQANLRESGWHLVSIVAGLAFVSFWAAVLFVIVHFIVKYW